MLRCIWRICSALGRSLLKWFRRYFKGGFLTARKALEARPVRVKRYKRLVSSQLPNDRDYELTRKQNDRVTSLDRENVYPTPEDRVATEAKAELIAVDRSLLILPTDASSIDRSVNLLQIEPIVEVSIDKVGDIEAIAIVAQVWFHLATQKYTESDILGAITNYERALAIIPNYHDAWYNRGVALKDLGRYEEAVLSYDKALEIRWNYETWNNRGAVLRNLGRLSEAIASYDKALELKADDCQAWYNRGIALFEIRRIDEAIASYDKALELFPSSHEAWNNRGNALLSLGRLAEAIASYEKAIEIKADKAEAWNNRGTALFNSNCFEEAILSYKKALEIKPNFQEAWKNMGNALVKLKRVEEAISSYEKVMELK